MSYIALQWFQVLHPVTKEAQGRLVLLQARLKGQACETTHTFAALRHMVRINDRGILSDPRPRLFIEKQSLSTILRRFVTPVIPPRGKTEDALEPIFPSHRKSPDVAGLRLCLLGIILSYALIIS